MSRSKTRSLIFLTLAATLLAAYFAPSPANDDVALSERTRAAAGRGIGTAATGQKSELRSESSRTIVVPSLRSRDVEAPSSDAVAVFAATQWTAPTPKSEIVPTPVAVVPEPPPPVQAAPLPFQVFGLYVEDGQVGVFLQYNDQSLVARVGETIADHYKVESIQGGTLTLRYLPLDQTQTLEIGGDN